VSVVLGQWGSWDQKSLSATSIRRHALPLPGEHTRFGLTKAHSSRLLEA
jgi:hypothetical protein